MTDIIYDDKLIDFIRNPTGRGRGAVEALAPHFSLTTVKLLF